MPPRPHLTFCSIPIRSIKQETADVNDSRRPVTQILSRPGPPLDMFEDQTLFAKTAEDRGGMRGADPEQSCGRINKLAALIELALSRCKSC